MKKYLLATVALALSMGMAHAGESKFDGLYGGVQGSYSRGDNTDIDIDGFGGGAFGGYGKTFGNWYVGGELSVDYNKVDGKDSGIDAEKKLSYGAAARAGYLFTPKVLGYGVLGWEQAKFEFSNGTDSLSKKINGVRVGLGVETFVKENITLRTEVNYIDWQGKNDLGDGGEVRANVGLAYHF